MPSSIAVLIYGFIAIYGRTYFLKLSTHFIAPLFLQLTVSPSVLAWVNSISSGKRASRPSDLSKSNIV